jgi:hypothetical protein
VVNHRLIDSARKYHKFAIPRGAGIQSKPATAHFERLLDTGFQWQDVCNVYSLDQQNMDALKQARGLPDGGTMVAKRSIR